MPGFCGCPAELEIASGLPNANIRNPDSVIEKGAPEYQIDSYGDASHHPMIFSFGGGISFCAHVLRYLSPVLKSDRIDLKNFFRLPVFLCFFEWKAL
jgi:hypothetical protein